MLTVHNIHKHYADKTVAHDISFSVSQGEMIALLGASGSGKSTLLNIIAGLTAADSGSVVLNGRELNPLAPEKRNIAMMFQDFALLPHLNVLENVMFGLKMRGIKRAEAEKRAYYWLQQVGLNNMEKRRIQTLSGGEQQRTALARALVVEPDLLLLDEPFSAIDTTLRTQLQNLVRQLIAQQNIPAVLVTHDPAEACMLAQQIALLAHGSLIQIGTPSELLQRPNSAAAARLLGCLNVTDDYYIAPQAIHITTESALSCPILALFRQPNRNRLDFLHPQFGALTAYVNDSVLAGIDNKQVSVRISPNDVVYFR